MKVVRPKIIEFYNERIQFMYTPQGKTSKMNKTLKRLRCY